MLGIFWRSPVFTSRISNFVKWILIFKFYNSHWVCYILNPFSLLLVVRCGAFQSEEVEQGWFYRSNATKAHGIINLNYPKCVKFVILSKMCWVHHAIQPGAILGCFRCRLPTLGVEFGRKPKLTEKFLKWAFLHFEKCCEQFYKDVM